MGASKIGVEELLPQKRYHKNNPDFTDTSEKTYCSGKAKKSCEGSIIGILTIW